MMNTTSSLDMQMACKRLRMMIRNETKEDSIAAKWHAMSLTSTAKRKLALKQKTHKEN